MITFILIAILVILLTLGLVWAIDKFIPSKAKPVITILLWLLIGFLGYITFMSVYNPILFKQEKEKRYAKVVENLVDIRDSQLAYKEVNGKFTKNYDTLIKFIENGKFPIVERRDTSVVDVEKTRAFQGIVQMKEITISDTLRFEPVKDSLFKGSDRYKKMMHVPFAKEGTKFTLNAGEIVDSNNENKKLAVFEAFVYKKDILHDQDPDYVRTENEARSVEEINGDAIRVGSMEEVKVNGNWPKPYDPKRINTDINISHKALSIQVSLNGLSFCVLNTQSNTITSLKVFPKAKKQTPEELLDNLKHVFNTETVLADSFDTLSVIHVNELSAIVPKPMFNEEAIADYLKLNAKILKTDFITHDEIAINDSVTVYVPYINVNNFIYDQFGDFTYKHYATVLVETLLVAEKNSKAPKLYAHICNTHFELIAIKDSELILYNTFDYLTAEDFIYYVLFTTEQLTLNPETIELVFLGDVFKNDSLYNMAYKYIRNISFGNSHSNLEFNDEPIANHNHFTLLNSF